MLSYSRSAYRTQSGTPGNSFVTTLPACTPMRDRWVLGRTRHLRPESHRTVFLAFPFFGAVRRDREDVRPTIAWWRTLRPVSVPATLRFREGLSCLWCTLQMWNPSVRYGGRGWEHMERCGRWWWTPPRYPAEPTTNDIHLHSRSNSPVLLGRRTSVNTGQGQMNRRTAQISVAAGR